MKSVLAIYLAMVLLAACSAGNESLTPTNPLPVSTLTALPTATQSVHEERVPFDTSDWRTDFKKHSVPFSDIISGGVPKDAIPAIDKPKFVSAVEANAWLKDNEPVVLYQNNREARAYPMQILIWHEIVNDTVGGKFVVITFCPLCNTSIVFERIVAGQTTTFGTTGKLRYSDLVMYDRLSETWWQQATGEAILGEHTGDKLKLLPSQVISFGDFKARFPDGMVLSRETGYTRNYGANPYVGYDDPNKAPFLYHGPETPGVLRPTDYVATLAIGDTAIAYPLRVLVEKHVINDTVADQDIVVFWKGGTSSALDARTIAQGKDIGATGVYSRKLNDRTLTFIAVGDRFKDAETGTTWNILGQAVEGALAGQQLAPLVHGNHFWFAWAAFRPDSKLYGDKK